MANGKKTGRDGLAYLGAKGTELVGAAEASPSLVVGTWYVSTGQAESGSKIPVTVGHFFVASKADALVVGDKCVPVTFSLLGYARSKSLDASKSVVDATTDIDDVSDFESDGLVTTTGSINGYDIVGGSTSAVMKIKEQFAYTVYATAGSAGAADSISEVDISTPKNLLMIDWTAREPVEGASAEIDLMPVIFTQASKSVDYGSIRTLNCNFSVVSDDGAGVKPTHYVGPYRLPAA